jgi:hypothetical protein
VGGFAHLKIVIHFHLRSTHIFMISVVITINNLTTTFFLATNRAAAQQFDLREDERLGFPNDFWRELQVGLMFALTT